MKTKNFFPFIFSIILTLVFSACNSTGYDIETLEESNLPVLKEESSAGQQVPEASNENISSKKDEVQSPPENSGIKNKYKAFTIQIGAFGNSASADKFSAKAKNKLDYEIINIFEDGLHKIRTGKFNNYDEAFTALEHIRSSGYTDSFIAGLK